MRRKMELNVSAQEIEDGDGVVIHHVVRTVSVKREKYRVVVFWHNPYGFHVFAPKTRVKVSRMVETGRT